VVAFSEALYHELKPDGVMVTVVNPGFVVTDSFPQDEIKNDRTYGRLVMEPERVGRAIADVVRRRKGPEVSVPGWMASGQAVRVLAPPLYRAAMSRLVARRTLDR
jgi:short-subunit dehydrogenase